VTPLSPAAEKFVLHWGEMGTRWGVNRTVAQIHALLYVSAKPLNAEQIVSTLGVARSNVSASLRELQRWGVVRVTHLLGDRCDYFESLEDTWEMIKRILEERKRREIDPSLEVLEACLSESRASRPVDKTVERRLREMLGMFQTMDAWYREVMSLPSDKAKRLMRMSRQVSKLLRFRA